MEKSTININLDEARKTWDKDMDNYEKNMSTLNEMRDQRNK